MRKQFCIFLLAMAATAYADVTPHPLFQDSAVLQRGMSVPVWGWADNGEKVTVKIQGKQASTRAENGKWMVKLGKLSVGGPYEMTIEGNNSVTVHNVLVGDVWVCSGQSNMQWSVKASDNPDEETSNADYPKIRLFSVPRVVAGKPQETVDAEWVECSPDSVGDFSAVAYYFGRHLHKELGVPVGLIHTSWGGTPAESWTTIETLQANEDFVPIIDRWKNDLRQFQQSLQKIEDDYVEWQTKSANAEARGEVVPYPPRTEIPRDPRSHSWRPAGLYNAMINPLIPYAIKGAIWYQGESNAGRAYQYRTLFPAMITDWREQWGQGDFPFFFVQLANFKARRDPEPDPVWNSAWAELREAQLMTLELPKTGMAVTTDIGDPVDIHPRNKQDVGKRLALAALKVAYGKNLVYSGPVYSSMSKKGNEIVLSFSNAGGGLTTRGGEDPKGFWIAGEDGKFVAAKAEIDGNKVVVSSPAVSDPAAVRYGWEDNPESANLYNEEMLPATPFRTDDWKGVTADAR